MDHDHVHLQYPCPQALQTYLPTHFMSNPLSLIGH